MEAKDIRHLKSGVYLWDTKHNRVVECYGCPKEFDAWSEIDSSYQRKKIKMWGIDAFIHGKRRKNVNRVYIWTGTCEQYIIVDNPAAAKILYGK